jgi:hypothetical protein
VKKCGSVKDCFGSIARERFLPSYAIALTLLGLGEHERAMEFLERGPHARFRQLIQRCQFERADPPAGALD